ncbi:spore coat U domain-containing protein [Sphingobium baderi]|uniref:spore coat U domain-containing protein n=1 Tax=Sphingobium baderi TaxID=1332080 RepID=UPI002B4021CA|nr:spore coat U domain-containing protein [Sphingobium baderi]WRD78865.1 spore coat U domain-containing protein [Sphingobium baderi]
MLGFTSLCLAAPAGAGTSEGSGASCHLSVSALVFPPYDRIMHRGSSAIGTIQLDCPPDVRSLNPRILLSTGQSGRFSERRMTSGRDSLRYNLFVEPSHRRVIGDGTGGSEAMTIASIHTASRAVFTVYGMILPGQAVTPGRYSDDLTIQMEF